MSTLQCLRGQPEPKNPRMLCSAAWCSSVGLELTGAEMSAKIDDCQWLQIIYTANEEVARGLYNPAYKLLQMLPGRRNKGQVCMHRFHCIMQDLLQEVPPCPFADSALLLLHRLWQSEHQRIAPDWLAGWLAFF